MKVYVRLQDYDVEGQFIEFATTDTEKAFSPDDRGTESCAYLYVYENEQIVEVYSWSSQNKEWAEPKGYKWWQKTE